jgi:hypothetical protein
MLDHFLCISHGEAHFYILERVYIMKNIKKQLIRLGSNRPSLREDIRQILDHVTGNRSVSANRVVNSDKFDVVDRRVAQIRGLMGNILSHHKPVLDDVNGWDGTAEWSFMNTGNRAQDRIYLRARGLGPDDKKLVMALYQGNDFRVDTSVSKDDSFYPKLKKAIEDIKVYLDLEMENRRGRGGRRSSRSKSAYNADEEFLEEYEEKIYEFAREKKLEVDGVPNYAGADTKTYYVYDPTNTPRDTYYEITVTFGIDDYEDEVKYMDVVAEEVVEEDNSRYRLGGEGSRYPSPRGVYDALEDVYRDTRSKVASRRRVAMDPHPAYEKYKEKERARAREGVEQLGRNRYSVDHRKYDITVFVDPRRGTYRVAFGDGTLEKVTFHGGLKETTNYTMDTSKTYAASKAADMVRSYRSSGSMF